MGGGQSRPTQTATIDEETGLGMPGQDPLGTVVRIIDPNPNVKNFPDPGYPGGVEKVLVPIPAPPSKVFKFVLAMWLFLAFAGWVIALGGLSRLQDKINGDPGRDTYWWSVIANYPDLTQTHVLRFDWFTVFLQFVVYCMILLVLWSKAMEQARVSVVGILAVTTVLQIISADRMYNIRAFRNFTPASCAFSGYIIAATADFALIYHLGLRPLILGF